jgi:hypothetical protein
VEIIFCPSNKKFKYRTHPKKSLGVFAKINFVKTAKNHKSNFSRNQYNTYASYHAPMGWDGTVPSHAEPDRDNLISSFSARIILKIMLSFYLIY